MKSLLEGKSRMNINLHSFMKGEESEIIFEVEDFQLEDIVEGEIIYPIKGKLKLMKLGDRFLLDGHIELHVRRKCAVCGELVDEKVDIDIDDEFVIGEPDYGGSQEIELTKKDMYTFYLKDGILDVASVVRDYIITTLDTVPLCDGHKRKDRKPVVYNLGDVEEKDPRLSDLRKLLEGGAKSGSSEEETNS